MSVTGSRITRVGCLCDLGGKGESEKEREGGHFPNACGTQNKSTFGETRIHM